MEVQKTAQIALTSAALDKFVAIKSSKPASKVSRASKPSSRNLSEAYMDILASRGGDHQSMSNKNN